MASAAEAQTTARARPAALIRSQSASACPAVREWTRTRVISRTAETPRYCCQAWTPDPTMPRTELSRAAQRSVTTAVTAAHLRLVTAAPSSTASNSPVLVENTGTTEVTVGPGPSVMVAVLAM